MFGGPFLSILPFLFHFFLQQVDNARFANIAVPPSFFPLLFFSPFSLLFPFLTRDILDTRLFLLSFFFPFF